MKDSLKIFAGDLKNSFMDLLPIIIVVALFQGAVIRSVPDNLLSIVIGLTIVAVGLALFIRGLELGIFPIGEGLAVDFARKGSVFWLLTFAFTIGFSTTVAEPAFIAIAAKAAAISHGLIDAFWLRMTVGPSVGFAIALGVLRILLGHPISYYIIIGYILVVAITFFAPPKIIGLAYDLIGTVKDVAPIIAVIFFIVKKPVAHLQRIVTGIIMVILGLYAFIVGLEMGLFPIGETISYQLTDKGNNLLIYLFAFLIGFSTTMAEPALLAIAIKAEEISEGNWSVKTHGNHLE